MREGEQSHKGPLRGGTLEPQAAEFPHKAMGVTRDTEVSLEVALGLAFISLHSYDVQRVLKGRVSILQMDPQKTASPSSPPPATSAKHSPKELLAKLGSSSEAKGDSGGALF